MTDHLTDDQELTRFYLLKGYLMIPLGMMKGSSTAVRSSENEANQETPFDVYVPGAKDKAPELITTIEVEVEDRFGQEFLTLESRQRIENIRARPMGLMSGSDIKKMRSRLNLTQKELTQLIQCGEKSLSRWENGHGFPVGVVNTLLRLLDEGYVTPAMLSAVQGPRPDHSWLVKKESKTDVKKTRSRSRQPNGASN